MSYTYQNLDGYKFICELFAIISREGDMIDIFNENAKNLASSLNDDIVLEFLTEKWIGFSDVVVNKNSVIKEVLFDHFQKYHARKNEEGWNLLNNYFYDWKPTVNAIVKERKETRDPKVAFGIAMSIASSMLNQSDTYFYIGEEAAKKILFRSLSIFNYQAIEFIPDEFFSEEDNFRKLLFSALYSALLFLFPAKGGQTRINNYNNGAENILRVIKSDSVSKLYTAFQHVAESKSVAEQLWNLQDIRDTYLCFGDKQKLSMEDFYIVPEMISPKGMGVLTCEKGQPIRSLVEGKSGCGKSTLARMMAFMCQHEVETIAKYKEVAKRLDFQRKMCPLIISCKNLIIDDIKEGIIECGLRQMLVRANTAGANVSYQRFIECEKYLIAFCNHKILQGDMILIIDDYSKIPSECINEFNRLLKALCAKATLHVVVITDNLKPSAKLRLKDAFSGLFHEFGFKDILYIDPAYISSVINSCGVVEESSEKPDAFAQMYVNTPRRLLRYAQALLNGENIHTVISSSLDEELDIRTQYIDYRDEYSGFIRELTLLALKERRQKDRRDNRLTITEKQARKVKGKNKCWNDVWACIETESIMLEQCKEVNSMEFSTPIYLYSILADYYLEILQEYTSDQCANMFIEGFSYLSCVEFANVIALVFHRLYEEDFENISDANVELFIKAIVSKIFEVETMNDLEYVQWALSSMISDNYRVTFIHGGNTVRREKIWSVLYRAFISLDVCKDAFCEEGLLAP